MWWEMGGSPTSQGARSLMSNPLQSAREGSTDWGWAEAPPGASPGKQGDILHLHPPQKGRGSTPHPAPPSPYLRQHPLHGSDCPWRDVPGVSLLHHEHVEGALLQHHVEGGVGKGEGADVHDGPAQAGAAAGVAGAHGRDAGGGEVDAGDVGVAQLVQVMAQGTVAAACAGGTAQRGIRVPVGGTACAPTWLPRTQGRGRTGWGSDGGRSSLVAN